MLNLPKSTELLKQLPKKAIYAKFEVDNATKVAFDKDVSKLNIINEISSKTIALENGEKVNAIYVILVELKRRDYSDKSINLITKLIKQNLILLLHFQDDAKLITNYNTIQSTAWQKLADLSLSIQGLNLDTVWENFIRQIGSIENETNHSLDEQININLKREELEKKIHKLERKAALEKQPHKRFALAEEISRLKNELGKIE